MPTRKLPIRSVLAGPGTRQLLRDGADVGLSAKAFQLLAAFCRTQAVFVRTTKLNVSVEDLHQRQQLIDRLAIVRLVK